MSGSFEKMDVPPTLCSFAVTTGCEETVLSPEFKGEGHRVALADSITLTPGTITCQLRGDEYVVHCLDESMAEGMTDGALITALKEMEAKG